MNKKTVRGLLRQGLRVAIVASGFCLLALPASAGGGGKSAGAASRAIPSQHISEQAAFVRGGALWVKERGSERRLTEAGGYARNPAWSPDGRWIAYNAGEDERQLWVVEAGTGKRHLAAPEGGSRFLWSPARNRLAYLSDGKLRMVGAEEGDEPADIAADIGNFGWLPDGSGFIVSSAAQLLPEGWTPVRISRILLPGGSSDPVQEEPLHVLPKQIGDQIVVGTTGFKWSGSGEWVAFLAIPTASLSADANTLCVLSADGRSFLPFDSMAHNERWFEWSPKSPAPAGDRLAYIAGIGRDATSNKRLKVTPVPSLRPVVYTPDGFVDQNPAWYGDGSIVVSRAKEGAWAGDHGKRPMPFLVQADLSGGRQTAIAKPGGGRGDFSPERLTGAALGWVRSDRTVSDVLVAKSAAEAKNARPWIKGIDAGDNFYEQWNWLPVLRFYSPERAGPQR
ncbi:TolB family protein [Paenibacillus glycinis]|uniref:Translocation protein TolB n=1 Tax=Paenibacillus glycinis TaxID=2697035 RepID=A0ABW9XT20_9BACL|nr:PD40 domain-containing protein [Paenibacillus glycinis]NBD25794.1 hypothetical protein [Paenibacillus glycinis]